MDKNLFNDPHYKRRLASRIWIPRFVAFQLLLFILAAGLLLIAVPYFSNYYRKLDLMLSGSTTMVLDASSHFQLYWYLDLVVWAIIIGAIGTMHVSGAQRLAKFLNWSVFCVFTAAFFLSIVALFLPYFSIGAQ